MMRKILGAVLALFCAFFFVAGGMALAQVPGTVRELKTVVWLGDSHYDPANEGKLVAVSLNLADLGNAIDPEVGVEFTVPAVRRVVEYFNYDGIEQHREWVRIEKDDDMPLYCTAFAGGNTNAQALELAEEFSVMLPSGRDLDVADMTPESQERILSMANTVLDQGRVYFSNAAAGCFLLSEEDREIPPYHLEDQDGMIRFCYSAPWESDTPIVVIGIQKGNVLTKYEDLGTQPVFEGEQYDSLEAVIQGARNIILFGAPAVMLACALGVFQGLRLMGIVKWSPKKRKETEA